MNYSVRKAKDMDGEAMLALLPRLAAFELPDSRTAEHLWVHDAALMRDWIDGKTDNVLMHIAEDEVGTVVGVAPFPLVWKDRASANCFCGPQRKMPMPMGRRPLHCMFSPTINVRVDSMNGPGMTENSCVTSSRLRADGTLVVVGRKPKNNEQEHHE